jgi:hypothetical protein
MIKYGQLLSKRVAKVSCSRKILTRREVKGLIDGGPDSPCDAMWETSHFYAIKYHELVSTREKPYVHTHMYIYIYIYIIKLITDMQQVTVQSSKVYMY